MKNRSLRDEIIQYAADQYGTHPERLWEKYPNYIVLRNSNGKWYAIIMDVPRAKLGISGDGIVDVIDLKVEPLLAGSLRLSMGFLPAYHMNKEKWIAVLLDGTVDKTQIMDLLNMSYELTACKKHISGTQKSVN